MHEGFVRVEIQISCAFFFHVIFERYAKSQVDLFCDGEKKQTIERNKWNYMAGKVFLPFVMYSL